MKGYPSAGGMLKVMKRIKVNSHIEPNLDDPKKLFDDTEEKIIL